MAVSKKCFMVWVGVWLVLLACAFAVDQPIIQWLYAHGFHDPRTGTVKDTRWAHAIKMIGSYQTVTVLAALLVCAGMLTWRKAGTMLLCAATSIVAEPLKWATGRPRPVDDNLLLTATTEFVPFTIREPSNSFPSGHAMIAFATAACLARYYPRWWPLFYGLATLVAVERVLELAHHPSDVVAAAGIGVALSHGCMWALSRWASSPRQQPEQEAVEEGTT